MIQDVAYIQLTELDREIFDATVPADHYLRRVMEVVDFERFRELLISRYSRSMGRPPIEPLLLLKLEFLQYQYDLSDREVIAQTCVNMAYRLFLGLSLHSPLPDPSLLSKFRGRLGAQVHQEVFHDLIAQARQLGLVKDQLRLKDATHILANIALPSTLQLVAQTREQLLEAARPYAPDRVAQEEAEAVRVRTSTAGLPDQERLLHRVTHLRAMVTWADELLGDLERQSAAVDMRLPRLREALDLAHKVLHDRDDSKAPDKVVSVHDPEARNGWHHQWFAGYLLDASVDPHSEFITAVDVLPPSADEAANATALIEQEEQAHGNDIKALSIDSVGFRGDLLKQWTDPEGLNLEVIVPPKEPPPSSVFPPEAFTLNSAGDELTCPAGKTTHKRQRNTNDTGWKYRFSARQCAGCPLREQCLQEPKKTKSRCVIKNEYEETYRAAREKAKTARYQEVRRQHPLIERKLGEMVRWHDCRHARYWGRAKVLIQALMTGLVVNVKRFVKLVNDCEQPAQGMVRASQAALGAEG
jgi:transposase/DnaJ-domain-containing protein 1